MADAQRRYALIGARMRLEQIEQDKAEVLRLFPELAVEGLGIALPSIVAPKGRGRPPKHDATEAAAKALWQARKAKDGRAGKRTPAQVAALKAAQAARWEKRRRTAASAPVNARGYPMIVLGNRRVVNEAALTPDQRATWLRDKARALASWRKKHPPKHGRKKSE